jgi:hypothetical protein
VRRKEKQEQFSKQPENKRGRAVQKAWSWLSVGLRHVEPIIMQREPIVLNQIVVAPELCEIVAAFVRTSAEQLAVHRMYIEAIGTDCQPIANVVRIRAATTTIECKMVGGMLGEAPVADEFCRQAIVAPVGGNR